MDTLSHRALVNDRLPSPCNSHTHPHTHMQVAFLSLGYLNVLKLNFWWFYDPLICAIEEHVEVKLNISAALLSYRKNTAIYDIQ